jgi:amino acid transporter
MDPRLYIMIMLSLVTCAVLFGIGAVAVLSVPAPSELAKFLLPVVIVASFVLGPIIAWFMAPRLRARYWKARDRAADAKP